MDGINDAVIVAYEGRPPIDRMNQIIGSNTNDSSADTRVYARKVRRHTALADDRLHIITEQSPYYAEAFEHLKMGEETVI